MAQSQFLVEKEFKTFCFTLLSGWDAKNVVEDYYCTDSMQSIPISFWLGERKVAVVGLPTPIDSGSYTDFIVRQKIALMKMQNLQQAGWLVIAVPVSESETGRPFTRMLLRGLVESLLDGRRKNGNEGTKAEFSDSNTRASIERDEGGFGAVNPEIGY